MLFYLLLLPFVYVFLWSPISRSLSSSSANGPTYDLSGISQNRSSVLVYPDEMISEQCPEHTFPVHILSRQPLVIYLPNFISDAEAQHIKEISEKAYIPSTVFTNNEERLDPTIRLSEKAMLNRTSTISCFESRALSFQGWPADTYIERLWSQRYGVTGHYSYHFDSAGSAEMAGRVSTFMVYVEGDCVGGGTHFPRLQISEEAKKSAGARWCDYVECDSDKEGVVFKPVAGNAVYWENFRPDGHGGYGRIWDETWHAALPVESGTKIGLNVWSWFQRGHHPHLIQETK